MIARLRLCLFKRPTGFVRYQDNSTAPGVLRSVKGMQVWGLIFSIPHHTYTNASDYYSFPWRFVAATIMVTKAKNNRVNIKPITHRVPGGLPYRCSLQ